MQTSFFKQALSFVFLAAAGLLASAFTRGGDSYEIYLNQSLILKQYVHMPLNVKYLPLAAVKAGDQLVVHYSHCGVIGKGRTMSVKDAAGKTLKQWKFADADGKRSGMVIPALELVQLQKSAGAPLQLVYASRELSGGRLLTSLQPAGSSTVYSKPLGKGINLLPAL